MTKTQNSSFIPQNTTANVAVAANSTHLVTPNGGYIHNQHQANTTTTNSNSYHCSHHQYPINTEIRIKSLNYVGDALRKVTVCAWRVRQPNNRIVETNIEILQK